MSDERMILVSTGRSPAIECGICGFRTLRVAVTTTGRDRAHRMVCVHCQPELLAPVSHAIRGERAARIPEQRRPAVARGHAAA